MTTTQHVPVTDHQVKEAIVAELEWTPNVQADRIGVAINDGAVTLSGQVQTYPEKHEAMRAAFRVRGVTAIADEIDVHNTWGLRDDTDIAREAAELLSATPMASEGAVNAEVRDQIVTLTGSVAWHYQREAIRHAVAALPGVHGVTSVITLSPRTRVSAGVAKARIAAALRRNASIEAGQINVEVAGATITLSGTVATWAERTQADHATWATPGVLHVENNLRVNP